MKKILSLALAAVMVFALCACGETAAPVETPNVVVDTTKAPNMRVMDGEHPALIAESTNYQWSSMNEDETYSTIDAAGIAPTDPENKLLSPKMYIDEDKTYVLTWDINPDTAQISGWDLGVFDDVKNADNYVVENVALSPVKDADGNEIPGQWAVDLKGGTIYSVSANWEEKEAQPFGSALYCFIVDSILPPQVEDEEPAEPEGPTEEEMIAGGWAVAEDMEITEDLVPVFEKAVEGKDGTFTPIAVLGTQVVAGINRCFLAQHENDGIEYALVYVYEDLQGNANLMNIKAIDLSSEDFSVSEMQLSDAEDAVAAIDLISEDWVYTEDYTVPEEFSSEASSIMPDKAEFVAKIATLTLDGTDYSCVLANVENNGIMLLFGQAHEADAESFAVASKLLVIGNFVKYGGEEEEEVAEDAETAETEEGTEVVEGEEVAETEDTTETADTAESTETAVPAKQNGVIRYTYKATKGGTLTDEYEDIDWAAGRHKTHGCTAKADPGYTFRGWEDENGKVLNTHSFLQPKVTADSPDQTFIAVFVNASGEVES